MGNLDVDIVRAKYKLPLGNEKKVTAKQKKVSGVNRQRSQKIPLHPYAVVLAMSMGDAHEKHF